MPNLIGPNIHVLYRVSREDGPNHTVCLICGRRLSTRGSGLQSHADKHVRILDVEVIRRREEVIGVRTPGTPGFFLEWVDVHGNRRALPSSAYSTAERSLKDSSRLMGRDRDYFPVPVDQ